MIQIRRFDFFSLKLFVVVAEERSIARAAEREHVVPSAVSKRLTDLEAELGVELLLRHAKGVDLTAAGAALLPRARHILHSMEATARELSDLAAEGTAHIRLAANHSSLVQFLPADLADFLHLHPRTKIDLVERFSVDVVRAVADGAVDVGIYCAPVAPPGVISFPYRKDELVLAVPNTHELAGRERIEFAEAIKFEFIGFFPNLSIESVYPTMASRAESHVRIQIANFDAICRMAKAGLGIALVPFGSASPHLADGRLVCVRLTDRWAHRQMHLCLSESGSARPRLKQFVDHLAGLASTTNE